ncbi:hypothetical protein AX16_003843 [Volvariella volvacea WC 439]|nr:hypothetical protein AX16_003843 [Volvariella volvacea WC 439]
MGVKSLWTLLTPVGRPIQLETVEGKVMAIDSSIWIYQFQATMRDKEGRGLVNAHVLGFLRRISKLLFYGIKPVFVFDGGAPVLKRNTLNDRKKKKSGAAASHAKIAERLLAAQMRREAVNHAQGNRKVSKGKGKALEDNSSAKEIVYLEDVDPTVPKSRHQPKSSTSPTKNKFYDHDPYKLPAVDLEQVVADATRSSAPDPRLATEEELQVFIEDMRPEDFDITSPEFRELPTEVQYEIIGDLRLKSRQTSYARLQNMLKNSKTPLDFSKQQILNLKQRNSLTQQLLITTDTIGQAHISIPVRIASERNRQYVLVKNEGADGGWVLALRDQGTKEKPIEIDQDDKDKKEFKGKKAEAVDDEDDDMEEVAIEQSQQMDSDLREYRRNMALAAIARRHTPKKPMTNKDNPRPRAPGVQPLFDLSDDELPLELYEQQPPIDDEDDEELAIAIQKSIDEARKAAQISTPEAGPSRTASAMQPLPTPPVQSKAQTDGEEHASLFGTSTRLETALSFANTRTQRILPDTSPVRLFGQPRLLTSQPIAPSTATPQVVDSDEDIDMEEVLVVPSEHQRTKVTEPDVVVPDNLVSSAPSAVDEEEDMEEVDVLPMEVIAKEPGFETAVALVGVTRNSSSRIETQKSTKPVEVLDPSDEEMEEIVLEAPSPVAQPHRSEPATQAPAPNTTTPLFIGSPEPSLAAVSSTAVADRQYTTSESTRTGEVPSAQIVDDPVLDEEDDVPIPWSRSLSPFGDDATRTIESTNPADHVDWDAAHEMDVNAEEGEFARFVSQVKGKDLDEVRKEIDEEIRFLNEQRKAALRDSEDVNQQMILQIMTMLRLFGIPYITAPMEAEAQCAELVSLGLVDGVITDDSDVFLFGAQRVFKNMFNQSKTVECFLLSDLTRELGLDRDTLIRLAYLLGSDYVDGLPGVGPVVAMELLKEFPGKDGLHKFREWWSKVQSGKDKEEDNKSKFRKQFKKKFNDLYLPADWPNPAVRDAYYHPTVDSSDEPFKWGIPDLDALREFFRMELGWQQNKVDDLLLPIIQRMSKRNKEGAINRQGTLTTFFDGLTGSGTVAPRKRQAYTSKRLQEVITAFRKQKGVSKTPGPEDSSSESSGSGSEEDVQPTKKRKTAGSSTGARGKGSRGRGTRGRARGKSAALSRGGKAAFSRSKKAAEDDSDESSSDDDEYQGGTAEKTEVPLRAELRPRPKPRPAHRGTQTAVVDPPS